MKKQSNTLTFLLLLFLMLIFPDANAETVTGSTTSSKTFYVHSNYADSYIVLSSSSGVANVAQHNWAGIYQQNGNEKCHGFYKVTQQGGGVNRSFIWAPSATTNTGNINTCEEVKISFPGSGDFTVTISPLSSSSASVYWKVDYISYWVYDASWMTTIESGCSVYPEADQKVYVDIVYQDNNGNTLGTDYKVLYTSSTNTVTPGRSFSGYSLISSREVTVTIDRYGNSNPSTIEFIYQKNYTPAPNPPTPVQRDLYGLAIQKLATRYGPSTSYAEGGTFEVKGQYIKVLARSYDNANGIWWVKCEIPDGGTTRVLWTGYKRFDSSTLPLNSIPIE